MQFEPKTEKQLQDEMLIPDGVYDFEVAEAYDKTSQKGSEMIALELRVFDQNGNPRMQRDWLVAASHPLCVMKIKHFCDSTGLDYDSGELSAQLCIGRSGLVELASKDSDQYGPQNTVKDYKTERPTEQRAEPPRRVPTASQNRELAEVPEDDIPF